MSVQHLTPPKHLTSLATSGKIVRCEVSVWTAQVQDDAESRKVVADNNAAAKAAKVMKNVLAGNPLHKALMNNRQTVYNWMQRRTLDWAGSDRFCPAPTVATLLQEYAVHEQRTNDLKEDFLKAYPAIVSDMAFLQSGMGSLFRREDYPTVEEVRGKFNIRLFVSDVPSNDFRVQIADDLAADLDAHYNREMQRYIDRIAEQQVEQLVSVMQSLKHCCDSDVTIDKDGVQKVKRRKIYDTTVQKALEYCDTFATFNPTQNHKLEEARAALARTLSAMPSIDALKESDSLREQVRDDVSDILKKFGL